MSEHSPEKSKALCSTAQESNENEVQKRHELVQNQDDLKIAHKKLNLLNKHLEDRVRGSGNRIKQLNDLLKVIRKINQLIVKTRDRRELIQRTCEIIVKSQNFSCAWIVLIDDKGLVTDCAESGHGLLFKAMRVNLKDGKLPLCMQRALETNKLIITRNTDKLCPECPLSTNEAIQAAFSIALRTSNKTFGMLNVGFDSLEPDKEIIVLLEEVAGDIGFGLNNIALAEEYSLAREALQEREEKHRTLFETMIQGVLYQDANGRILSANASAERILGLTFDQLQGRTSLDSRWKGIHEDGSDFPGETHPSMIALKTGRTVLNSIMGIFHSNQEEPLWISISAIPQFKPGEKKPYQVYTTFQDITEQKKAQDDLTVALSEVQVANQVKDHFIANISHEIRTPLNSIIGFSDLLNQRYGVLACDNDKDIFNYIRKSSYRLMRTVDSIVNISQLNAGALKIGPREFDLNDIVRAVIGEIKPMADEKGLDLTYSPTAQEALVFVDDYSLQQAIFHLTENAIKYTVKGQVELKLMKRVGQYRLSVQDTGIGISEEFKKRIYQPYTQESEGFTKNYQGIGLGLALSKRFLELMDVELELDSQKNVGTTFTLVFPKCKGD